jgi:VanZ family protein
MLHLLGLVSRFSAVDLVSAGLGIAILAGLLQPCAARLGPERVRRWGAVLLYMGFIYATLPVMPRVWGALWGYTQGRVDYVGIMVAIVAGLALLVYLILRCRRPAPFLLVPPVAAVYALLLANLGRSPAERLHLAEYGLLSLLMFLALRIDMPRRRAYLWGWSIASAAGALDEGIQWLLPNRVFELKDIGLNIVCSGLGMLVVALLHDAQRDRG